MTPEDRFRWGEIVAQFERYSGVPDARLFPLLEAITDLNDDLINARQIDLDKIRKATFTLALEIPRDRF